MIIYEKKKASIPDIKNAVVMASYAAREQLEERAIGDYENGKTYRDIFNWVKNNVRYSPDYKKYAGKEFNIEDVKLPSRLIRSGVGDCKSFTAFLAGYALNFDNPVYLRTVFYSEEQEQAGMGHIYPFVKINGKNLYLDAVSGKYDYEDEYYSKSDTKL